MKVRLSKGDAIIGLILSGLGLWWLWMSWRLGLGSLEEPGPGFFPAGVSIALVLGGLGCAVHGWRAKDDAPALSWIDSTAVKAFGCILFLCSVFVVLGFVPTSLLFLILMLYFLGNVGFVKAVLMSALITLVFWLIFEQLLSLQLPSGLLGQ